MQNNDKHVVVKVNLTALESHWGLPEDSMFLGGWCKEAEGYDAWKQYNPVVLSHRWADFEELKKGLRYCLELSPKLIKVLADFLRQTYKIEKSDRFFAKLLTTWVNSFLSHFYCRYYSIKEACEKLEYPCFVTTLKGATFPPFDDHYKWHVQAALSHELNLHIFSDIVHSLELPCEGRQGPGVLACSSEKAPASLKRKALLFGQYFVNRLFNRDFYVVGNMYVLLPRLALECASMGKIVNEMFLSWPKIDVHADAGLRESTLNVGDDEFCRLVGQLILKYIPKGFLEAMPQYIEIGQKHPARYAKSFLTTLDNYYNLPWLYVLACSGAPVGILAHGGYSSVYAENIFNETEKQWADRVFDSGNGAYPLPNLALYRKAGNLGTEHTPDKQRSLLIVADVKWVYDRLAGVSPFKNEPYDSVFPKEYQFFDLLDPKIHVEYRHFLKPQNMLYFEPIIRSHKNISFHEMKDKPFGRAIAETALLCNINANWSSLTTYELLCANKACVIVYQDAFIPVTEKMVNLMNCLAEVGIVHYSVQSAAAHINGVFGKVDEWWQNSSTQQARAQFIEQFARPVDNDWPQKYYSALKELAVDYESGRLKA